MSSYSVITFQALPSNLFNATRSYIWNAGHVLVLVITFLQVGRVLRIALIPSIPPATCLDFRLKSLDKALVDVSRLNMSRGCLRLFINSKLRKMFDTGTYTVVFQGFACS